MPESSTVPALIKLSLKEAKFLSALGYCANTRGLHKEAKLIFKALASVQPQAEYPLIGMGVAMLYATEFDQAIDLFKDKILKINPQNASAKAYLGLAYKLNGQFDQGNAILREVVEEKQDKVAVHLAEMAIESAFKVVPKK